MPSAVELHVFYVDVLPQGGLPVVEAGLHDVGVVPEAFEQHDVPPAQLQLLVLRDAHLEQVGRLHHLQHRLLYLHQLFLVLRVFNVPWQSNLFNSLRVMLNLFQMPSFSTSLYNKIQSDTGNATKYGKLSKQEKNQVKNLI